MYTTTATSTATAIPIIAFIFTPSSLSPFSGNSGGAKPTESPSAAMLLPQCLHFIASRLIASAQNGHFLDVDVILLAKIANNRPTTIAIPLIMMKFCLCAIRPILFTLYPLPAETETSINKLKITTSTPMARIIQPAFLTSLSP